MILITALLVGCGAVKFEEMTPEDTDTTYVDSDGDGYAGSLDCDESDASIHEGAEDEDGDGVDSDCDGEDD